MIRGLYYTREAVCKDGPPASLSLLATRSCPNSPQFTPIRPNSTNSRPPEHGSTPGRAPTLPPSAPDGSMDSLSPGRIYGTTSLDTGTNWRRLVPPPLFPTLWLAGLPLAPCVTRVHRDTSNWRRVYISISLTDSDHHTLLIADNTRVILTIYPEAHTARQSPARVTTMTSGRLGSDPGVPPVSGK